jgi:hypothetical protein
MEWFRHDSNANLDEKLQEVLLDYGLEGYGLYWYCIELIVGKTSSDNITFEIKHDARVIARNTSSTPQRVEEMMKRFIALGLFENNDGKITCLKVAKRLMSSATSNPQMRSIIQDIKQRYDTAINTEHHDCVMTPSPIIRPDKIRLDNIDKKTSMRDKSLDNGFGEFWQAYPKKVGKDAAYKSWVKVKARIDDVMPALTWQKESDQWQRNDGQYIPNPATYLNQGRWQDEQPVVDINPF